MPPGDSVTQEHKDRICQQIAIGRSLVSICKDHGMPSLDTVYSALKIDKSFTERYARAREDQADFLADEILTLSDTDLPTDIDGKVDSARVNQLRLQVDARKWIAAKLKPKKYGERQTVEHEGKLTLEQLLSDPPKKPEDSQ